MQLEEGSLSADFVTTRALAGCSLAFSCPAAYKLLMDKILVRRGTESDLPTLGRLGALLMQTHYAFDRQRFMAPGTNPAEGYSRFLGSQLNEGDVIVLVAERAGIVVGYVYAALHLNHKELREPAGFIHDLAVDQSSRRKGVAMALVEAAIEWLRARGAPRVLLLRRAKTAWRCPSFLISVFGEP